jgi:hypothetical protein
MRYFDAGRSDRMRIILIGLDAAAGKLGTTDLKL